VVAGIVSSRAIGQRALVAALTSAVLASVACGEAAPRIRVENAWSRPTIASRTLLPETPGDFEAEAPAPPSSPGVVYATVVNRGRASDRLTRVRATICESVEIHRTTLIDDRMRMAPVEGAIEVPAGGVVEMRPGGYHVMLFGLRRHLREGESFEIEFEFERSGPVIATAEVRAP